MYRLSVLLLLALLAPAVVAETAYILESASANLRSGQGSQQKILRELSPGSAVEVLETSVAGYTRVRLGDGTEGWVSSTDLTREPPAAVRVGLLESELARLKIENQRFKEEVMELRELAAEPLRYRNENDALQKEVLALKSEVRLLDEKSRLSQEDSERSWFLTGAGVLVGGLILGLIIPWLLRRRKKSNWGDFQ